MLGNCFSRLVHKERTMPEEELAANIDTFPFLGALTSSGWGALCWGVLFPAINEEFGQERNRGQHDQGGGGIDPDERFEGQPVVFVEG